MPARRRRTLSRSPSLRAKLWDKKMNPDAYKTILNATKSMAMERVISYQTTHEQLIAMVKRIVEQFGLEGSKTHEYMWYAEKMWKLTQTYKSKALQNEADFLYLYYRCKGDNDVVLRAIAQSLGIKISPIEDIINRLGVQVGVGEVLRKIAEGTITADGSEQTILEYTGDISRIEGYIDLSELRSSIPAPQDTVIIRVYVKIKSDGGFVLQDVGTFRGVQTDPALWIMPRMSGYGLKVTLQQVEGSYRTFSYLFIKSGS